MWENEYEYETSTNTYRVRDMAMGRVIKCTGKGVNLVLENGQEAFALFGHLPVGCTVPCTVLKKTSGKKRILVSIDSVPDRFMAA